MIRCYEDFLRELRKAGFSLAGGSAKGIWSVVPFSWEEQPYITDSPIRWHTEDPETDPWEWRMRLLEEGRGIAYAKLFFRIGGYITEEWYPYFLAVRRGSLDFEDMYAEGTLSFGDAEGSLPPDCTFTLRWLRPDGARGTRSVRYTGKALHAVLWE